MDSSFGPDEEGIEAYYNGRPWADNPYAVGTPEADQWAYGWDYARQEWLYQDSLEYFDNQIGD